jgi:protein-L-isoaspartate(D-aspartate) O-methyltransferase
MSTKTTHGNNTTAAARYVSVLGLACVVLVGGLPTVSKAAEESALQVQQARMLDLIATDFRKTADLTGISAMSESVRAALAAVPRHAFVAPADRALAYVNRPLSIGHGQTISQPFIVALMTELGAIDNHARVLEIGTGSGYQAAVLAHIARTVYSIEIIPQLAAQAQKKLAETGYKNVHLRVGDGNSGWPEAAPFDAIIVTAGGALPHQLLEQLAPAGRMIIPLEGPAGRQTLTVVTVDADATIIRKAVLPVRFVPLVSE